MLNKYPSEILGTEGARSFLFTNKVLFCFLNPFSRVHLVVLTAVLGLESVVGSSQCQCSTRVPQPMRDEGWGWY